MPCLSMLFAIIDSSRGTNAINIPLLCQCPLLLLLQHHYTKCKIQFLLFLIHWNWVLWPSPYHLHSICFFEGSFNKSRKGKKKNSDQGLFETPPDFICSFVCLFLHELDLLEYCSFALWHLLLQWLYKTVQKLTQTTQCLHAPWRFILEFCLIYAMDHTQLCARSAHSMTSTSGVECPGMAFLAPVHCGLSSSLSLSLSPPFSLPFFLVSSNPVHPFTFWLLMYSTNLWAPLFSFIEVVVASQVTIDTPLRSYPIWILEFEMSGTIISHCAHREKNSLSLDTYITRIQSITGNNGFKNMLVTKAFALIDEGPRTENRELDEGRWKST